MHDVRRALVVSLLSVGLLFSLPVHADSLAQVDGTVSHVDGSIVSLLGGLVKIDATSAVITRRPDGATLGIADIVPGVEIQATIASVASDGTLVASSIRVGRAEAVEFAGAIESVDASAGTFKLAGQTIKTDASTVFSGRTSRGQVKSLADLQAGDLVEVTASSSSAGLLATRVRAEEEAEPPASDHVTFRGTVESESAASWVVSGRTVKITATTHIEGQPAVGDTVEVEALKAADGTLTALNIERVGDGIGAHEEFTGKVESKSATSWVISGKTVLITSMTKIEGDPAVGDTVKVEASKASDGTLTALSIERVGAGAGEHEEFTGKVESKSATSWVISGKKVLITSMTRVEGDPAVGDTVKVEASKAADGTLTALEIKRVGSSSGGTEVVEFEGRVESKSASAWVISGKTVKVTGATSIHGNPAVGDTVEVKAEKASDGTLTALVIEKKHGDDGGGDGGDGHGGGSGGDGHGGGGHH